MRTDEFTTLFDRLLPDALDPVLTRVLGATVPRLEAENRFRVAATGRFSGHLVGDLLTQARNRILDGALVLMEEDVVRVLYFVQGRVAGADSNVLFDRLGRILWNEEILTEDDGDLIVEEEEQRGLAAAVARLPGDIVEWGLERRIREITSSLYFMPHAHFVLIEGLPNLDPLPTFLLSPLQLAMDGLRRYDEWRNRSQSAGAEDEALDPEEETRPTLLRDVASQPPTPAPGAEFRLLRETPV
jgi:hypothetical protein